MSVVKSAQVLNVLQREKECEGLEGLPAPLQRWSRFTRTGKAVWGRCFGLDVPETPLSGDDEWRVGRVILEFKDGIGAGHTDLGTDVSEVL